MIPRASPTKEFSHSLDPKRKSTARAADANDGSASLSVPSFHEAKERSDKPLQGAIEFAAGVMVYECSGLMFWFTRKKFVGSYLAFKATRRS
jgi:hypothetical protein